MAIGHLVDPRRHRRREQHGLAVFWNVNEDGVDFLGESHVEHLVGLVKDDDLDFLEIQCPASDEVLCATRGRDDDFDATLQSSELAPNWLASIYGKHLCADRTAVAVDGFGDLNGKFPSRHEHQGHRLVVTGTLD